MEFTGKSVQEAIELGLEALGISEENAEITVVKEAVKGLFGKVKENAVVEVKEKKNTEKPTKKEEKTTEKVAKQTEIQQPKEKKNNKAKINSQEIIEFTEKLLSLLEIDAKVEYSEDGENPTLNLVSDTSSKLIGFRGEVLDSIQTLVGAKANIGNEEYQKVVVDCENYRNRREDTLIALAKKLEVKADEIRREVMIEPMSAFERRIIHTALADSQIVTTRSDGKEPNRYVVIVPNNLEEGSKPYNAGRKNDDKRNNKFSHGKSQHGGKSGFKGHTNNFGEQKKKTSISFGTYLGNSLKDND